MNRYEILEKVGEGAYGEVMKCKHKDNGEIVAIKKFKEADNMMDKEQSKKTMFRELKLLREVKHDNIVSMKEAFRRKGRLYIVFEFVEETLLDLIEDQPKGMGMMSIRRIMYQVAKAVQYCHAKDIIHRDIKPENILIDKDRNVKICDFGFARNASAKHRALTDYVATRWYRAPELLLGSSNYDKQVDIWAMGCIMGEMVDGKPLFPGETELDQLFIVQNILGTLTPEQRELFRKNPRWLGSRLPEVKHPQTLEKRYRSLDKTAMSFLKGLLALNPNKRMSAEQCLCHQFFEEERLQDKSRHLPVPRLPIDVAGKSKEDSYSSFIPSGASTGRNSRQRKSDKTRYGFETDRSSLFSRERRKNGHLKNSRYGKKFANNLISEEKDPISTRPNALTPQPFMGRRDQSSSRSRFQNSMNRAPTSLGDYIGSGYGADDVESIFSNSRYNSRQPTQSKRKSSRYNQKNNNHANNYQQFNDFFSPRTKDLFHPSNKSLTSFDRSPTPRDTFRPPKSQQTSNSKNHDYLPSIHENNNLHVSGRERVEFKNGTSFSKPFHVVDDLPQRIFEDKNISRIGRLDKEAV